MNWALHHKRDCGCNEWADIWTDCLSCVCNPPRLFSRSEHDLSLSEMETFVTIEKKLSEQGKIVKYLKVT